MQADVRRKYHNLGRLLEGGDIYAKTVFTTIAINPVELREARSNT